MGIDGLREDIAKKDMEIIRLILERTEIARTIGGMKAETGIPIRDTDVEKKVIARYVEGAGRSGISERIMSDIARSVIEAAVEAQTLGRGVGPPFGTCPYGIDDPVRHSPYAAYGSTPGIRRMRTAKILSRIEYDTHRRGRRCLGRAFGWRGSRTGGPGTR